MQCTQWHTVQFHLNKISVWSEGVTCEFMQHKGFIYIALHGPRFFTSSLSLSFSLSLSLMTQELQPRNTPASHTDDQMQI